MRFLLLGFFLLFSAPPPCLPPLKVLKAKQAPRRGEGRPHVAGLAGPCCPARRLARTVKGPRPPALPRLRRGGRPSSSRAGGPGTRPSPARTVFQGRASPTPPPSDPAAPYPSPQRQPGGWWDGVSQVSLVAGGGLGAGRWAPRLPTVPTPRLGLTIGALKP